MYYIPVCSGSQNFTRPHTTTIHYLVGIGNPLLRVPRVSTDIYEVGSGKGHGGSLQLHRRTKSPGHPPANNNSGNWSRSRARTATGMAAQAVACVRLGKSGLSTTPLAGFTLKPGSICCLIVIDDLRPPYPRPTASRPRSLPLSLYPLDDSFVPKHIALLPQQRTKTTRQMNAKTAPGGRSGCDGSKGQRAI
jgi:hypothetical protein